MLRDYNTASLDGHSSFNTTPEGYYKAQTFTALSSYTITGVALKVARNLAPGNVTLGIWSTNPEDDNKPLAELCTGVVDGNDWEDWNGGDWVNYSWVLWDLSAGTTLIKGTRYAIVVYSTANIIYGCRTSNYSYAFGEIAHSSDSGANWAYYVSGRNTYDYAFKTYDDILFTSKRLFAAGNEDGGKHLWRLNDDGTSLTVEESYVLSGNISNMVYGLTNRSLFVSIGNAIYCYNADTMALVTSWGVDGVIDIGVPVNGLAIDSSGYLAVAHNTVGLYQIFSLYDANGALLWTAGSTLTGTIGWKVVFTISGNVNGTTLDGSSSTYIASRFSRSDGTILSHYNKRVSLDDDGPYIVSHQDDENKCLVSRTVGSTTIDALFDDISSNWISSHDTISHYDSAVHAENTNLFIVAAAEYLYFYYDVNGGEHPWADYTGVKTIPISGQNSRSLVKNTDDELCIVTDGGYLGICNLSGSCRSSIQPSSALLNAVVWAGDGLFSPIIEVHPISQPKNIGDNVTFSIAATGEPSPTYQWSKDSSPLSGETSNTLTLKVDANSGGDYTCTVTNVQGSVTSDIAILSIIPLIIDQSSDTKVLLGQSVILGITVEGTPTLTYQWYKNNVVISGETNVILTFFSTTNTPGTYTCIVKNGVGSDTSDPIIVTIVDNPYVWNPFNKTLDAERAEE